MKNKALARLLVLIPILIALGVWFSALSFVPVPWPDDSAFYFVAKELFKWPPKWVMLSQAPFEPTYAEFNFNTMPLYPILIGIGRWFGIDGSFLLKFWPLSAWALSGSLLTYTLFRRGLPFAGALLICLLFSLDPELRWASVLVRPESLIGLLGMALTLGLTFGYPKLVRPKKLWDPTSALLALSAYAHFNAIHLIPIVICTYFLHPVQLVRVGAITALYLTPWLLAVLLHFRLFMIQMETQWIRLAVPNNWLDNPMSTITGLFQALGSPEPWPTEINWIGVGMVAFFFVGFGYVFLIPWLDNRKKHTYSDYVYDTRVFLLPSFGWVLGSVWLFQSKPEVWFMYYVHASFWCFLGLFLLDLWKNLKKLRIWIAPAVTAILGIGVVLLAYINITQAIRLEKSATWHWPVYYDLIDCIDQQLTQLDHELGQKRPFRVWDPTFPDVTIELSRRHPDWQFTRTNDFHHKTHLAIQHGWNVEAVVVPETLNWGERNLSGPASEHREVVSTWMSWQPYFLYQLWTSPGWMPNRWVCQRGRWQAFLFMQTPKVR